MKKILFAVLGMLMPVFAFAQGNPTAPIPGNPDFGQVSDILGYTLSVLSMVVPIVLVLALIYFIWNVIQYVTSKDEEERGAAKSAMIYGLIGFFVVLSVWGLVNLIGIVTGVKTGGSVPAPCIPGWVTDVQGQCCPVLNSNNLCQ